MTSATDTILEADYSNTSKGREKGLDWYQCPIDGKVFSQLMKKNNWRPLLDNVGQLGFSLVTGAFALWTFHNLTWPWVAGAVYFHCSFYGFFGGGTGGHELSHKTMFKTQALNETFIHINGFLTWFNFVYFRRSHVKHHQFTVHDELDMEVKLPQKLRWYHWIFALTFNPENIYVNFSNKFRRAFGRRREFMLKSVWEQRIFPESKPEVLKRMVNWERSMIIGHSILAIIFITTGNWILVFLVTFAPFVVGWFGLLTHMPQHVGMKPDIADWRQSTRTYLASPFVSFFYWNMNYHVEHHMYPAIPYYNLPKLRKAIENDLPIAPQGLIATWKEIFDTLKHQKKNPDYHAELVYPSKTESS